MEDTDARVKAHEALRHSRNLSELSKLFRSTQVSSAQSERVKRDSASSDGKQWAAIAPPSHEFAHPPPRPHRDRKSSQSYDDVLMPRHDTLSPDCRSMSELSKMVCRRNSSVRLPRRTSSSLSSSSESSDVISPRASASRSRAKLADSPHTSFHSKLSMILLKERTKNAVSKRADSSREDAVMSPALKSFSACLNSRVRRRGTSLKRRGVSRAWLLDVFIKAGSFSDVCGLDASEQPASWAPKGLVGRGKLSRKSNAFNTASFVDLVVRPLTTRFQTCLWDLIPNEHIASPDTFISYSWQYPLVDLLSAADTAKYVWIDFVAVSQHVGSRTNMDDVRGIGDVVAAVGRTLLVLDIRAFALTRAWVLFEVVQSKYLEVAFFGKTGRAYGGSNSDLDLMKARDRAEACNYALQVVTNVLGNGDFDVSHRSLRTCNARASVESDRKMIGDLVKRRFGSYDEADHQIMKLLVNALVAFVRRFECEDDDIDWLLEARTKIFEHSF